MGAAAAIPIVLGGVSAAMGVAQARQQNRAISRSEDSARRAAEVQQRQLREQAEVERRKIEREAMMLRGRNAVAAAESGIGFGDTLSMLDRQVGADESFNLGLIEQNLTNALARSESGLDATLADLDARRLNPLVQAFSGGLVGATAGIQIEGFRRSPGVSDES